MDPFFAAIATVQAMKRQAETMLMSLTNVVATGVGYKIDGGQVTAEPAVIVSVVKKLPWRSWPNRRWCPRPSTASRPT